jgi:hypothetical protein
MKISKPGFDYWFPRMIKKDFYTLDAFALLLC